MRKPSVPFTLAVLAVLAATGAVNAQGLTVPPPGANQRAVVTQYMGMVSVTIDYNAPDVTSPQNEDRTGKIWGQLVPWGIAPNPFYPGFGSAEKMPWRVGSNENTTSRRNRRPSGFRMRLASASASSGRSRCSRTCDEITASAEPGGTGTEQASPMRSMWLVS